MNERLEKDLKSIDQVLNQTLDLGLAYLNRLDSVPTSVEVAEADKIILEDVGLGGSNTIEQFKNKYEKLMVASAGPRYWGFVTGGSTPAALAGDILASIYDQNTQTNKGHGDVSALIEFQTIDLLLDLFELPKDFMGGFVTGATMSNFTCLGVARQWVGNQLGMDIGKDGMTRPFKVLSAVPHSSAIKALSMLGLGSKNIVKVKVLEGNREAIDIVDLEQKIKGLHGEPFILISSGGTVNTVDFDDLEAIAKLKAKYNFWWHIDAAFGGFAILSKDHRHLLKGWEKADSITIDGHKWLNVPYESAFYFIKKEHRLLQVETFQNSNAPYLGDPLDNFNYLNFLPENSRRFKALPAWFTLTAYGRMGYQEIIERNIACAVELGNFIEQHDKFQLLAPVRLNTVCFALAGADADSKTKVFLNKLNDTGKVFMTPTNFDGKSGIRAAIVNWRTTIKDIELVQSLMTEVVSGL
ncbi:pyridoxal-dependent decarboxylase [Fulvivirga sp.]|uniref:pyridoxal phosphate-dependent decarboxylase family protein n=1 Tax=Fulvivirga sp. TaxID=1931237 RepID=UPI0032EF37B2